MLEIWRNLKTRFRKKNVVMNYHVESLNDSNIELLKKLQSTDGNTEGSLSNYQRGWNNKYINIIIVSDKEVLPDLIDKIKRL